MVLASHVVQPGRATVTVRGQLGYVFECAAPADYCFVPADCVYAVGEGPLLVNEIAYFRSGWAVRNRRVYRPEADGSFLFPETDGLVADPAITPVQEFIRRLTAWNDTPISAR